MDSNDRMAELERRLDRIEAALGIARISPPLPPVPARIEFVKPAVELVEEPVAKPEPEPATPSPVLPLEYPSTVPLTPPPLPVRQGTLEETIGLKWAGWAGAIVFVIGAGFLISWLYASGYFAMVPPAARVAAMAVVGVALIGAGEWVYRRFDPRAAAGLYGAGVAVLLLVGYAGHGFYGLYGPAWAFVAMGLATVIGAIVAGRAQMVSVGVLSIVGGAIAPALLSDGTPRPVGFFIYIGTLQLVALSLVFRGNGSKWWALRCISLAITSAWVLATLHMPAFSASVAATVFCLLSAAGYEAEVLASTRLRSLGGSGATFNLFITGLLTTALLGLSPGVGEQVLWVASLAAATTLLAMVCRRSSSMRMHGDGYLLQAVALVAVIAPVALSGQWIAVAWLAWAVALALANRWFNAPATRAVPLLLWMFAVGDLFLWSQGVFDRIETHAVYTLGNQSIPAATVIGLILAVGGLVIAALTDTLDVLDIAVPGAATVVWIAAALEGLAPPIATVTITAMAWILAAVSAVTRRNRLLMLAGATLAFAAVKWIVYDVIAARLSVGAHPNLSATFFSSSTIESFAIAASVAGIYLWRRREIDPYLAKQSADTSAVSVAAIIAGLLTFAATVEASRWVDRAIPMMWAGLSSAQWTQLLWTAVWTIGLVSFVSIAQWMTSTSPLRAGRLLHSGGVILLLLEGKFVLVDTGWFRIWGSPGPGEFLINPRFEAAALLLAANVLFQWRANRFADEIDVEFTDAVLTAMMTLAVWAGTLEIDQSLVGWTASTDAAHVVLSVFWAVSAIAALISGFISHRSAARYFGLALLAITLVKVFIVDLSHVQTGLRILSFMALGGVLLLTSVLYGKVSPARRAKKDAPGQ